MPHIAIIGATSAIATEVAKIYAQRNWSMSLLARNKEALSILQQDLLVRGAKQVDAHPFDALDIQAHQDLVGSFFHAGRQVDVALIGYGSLPDQEACEQDVDLALREIQINGNSTISLLGHFANHMQAQGTGNIAVITSVAGDRGRPSNYVYGAAKKMVSTYLQGLRGRLLKAKVNVLDIRPGFVDTPMTDHLPKGGPLWAGAEKVAKDIVVAIDKKKLVLYTPWFWRWILYVIKLIPETVFRRLNI